MAEKRSRYQIETTLGGRPIIVPVPDGWLNQLKNEWAQALMEKIRARANEIRDEDDIYRADIYADGMDAAADRIGSEVNDRWSSTDSRSERS